MHISSLAHTSFALLNGAPSPDPHVAASLQVGDTRLQPPSASQFSICDAQGAVHGNLTWDPDHLRHGSASPFFTVAPVRLEMSSGGECLLSVGTHEFVRLAALPYKWIEKVQIAALAGTAAPDRALNWDSIELVFCYADGRTETRRSSCLPKVMTGTRDRRAAQSAQHPLDRPPRQFAEIWTGSHDVVGVKVRGQVTLRANESAAASPLLHDDLQGSILVFTDACGRHA